MQRRELVRHLEQQGCALLREGGRHSIYCNPKNDKTAAVPRHREVFDALARRICRDLEIPEP